MTELAVQKPFHLVSIRFSHYVEKVRWTLDYFKIPYSETPLMPIIHWGVTPFFIGLSGSGDNHSTRFSTPILKTDQDESLIKSSTIMDYLSRRFGKGENELFPTEEVRRLDEHYSKHLGPHTRRLFYYNVLNKKEVMFDLARRNVPPFQTKLFKALFTLCRPAIIKGLDVTPQQVEKGLGFIHKEFEEVEKRLRDGRPYITGDCFTAADISFACLGGAIVLPQPDEGYGARLPDYECDCEQLIRISKEFRGSFVGQWVLRLFREKRGERLIPCNPRLM